MRLREYLDYCETSNESFPFYPTEWRYSAVPHIREWMDPPEAFKSWLAAKPAVKFIDLQARIAAALPTSEGFGVRDIEATEPNRQTKTIVNIKELPLISHKAAANRTDALKVLALPFVHHAWKRFLP